MKNSTESENPCPTNQRNSPQYLHKKKRVNKFHELAVSKTPQTIFFISAFLYTNKFIKKEFKKQRTAYVFLSLDMESV